MKNIHNIEFYTGSKEELLPGFEKDFPYIASRAELDKYIGCYFAADCRAKVWPQLNELYGEEFLTELLADIEANT